MSTYRDVLPLIQASTGNRNDPETDAIIMGSFNAVQNILARSRTWEDLEARAIPSLVIGQADYTYAELSLVRPMFPLYSFSRNETASVRGQKLDYYTPARWQAEIQPQIVSSTTSRPSVYTKWGKTVSVFKTPDYAYPMVILYNQFPEPVTRLSSILQFNNIDELLQFGTIALVWLALEEYELATIWDKKFQVLAKTYEIENISVIAKTFTSGVERSSGPQSDYWSNPFIRNTPK